ncbi:hypothetical protein ARMGADRAFT_924891 [Armillaria gallica]|uniref:Integrase core domain-containing protein n=1 Tax=Armillaria gallica TaxID=47427 RepID=A0A2H3E8N8_ARMGA|nr:hypothetical protein ARMGADRAFT_924891 [Armillaria gallica]
MINNRGPSRGSYIFGRSVHNTRIERLWYEVTQDFGLKWKNFFLELEVHHGLDHTNANHIWLIHFLWLEAINTDTQEWAGMWNSHRMTLPQGRPHTPREMFRSSMIHDGLQGLTELFAEPMDEQVDEPAEYGIDWVITQDRQYMEHHLLHNPQEWDATNPFSSAPPALSHVPCVPLESPFNKESIQILQRALSERVDLQSCSMEVCRLVWAEALSLCDYLLRMQNASSADVTF